MDSIGVIQVGALKMQIPMGIIYTFFLNKSFKRTNLISPRKQVNKVSENQRKKGNHESCSRTSIKANTSC